MCICLTTRSSSFICYWLLFLLSHVRVIIVVLCFCCHWTISMLSLVNISYYLFHIVLFSFMQHAFLYTSSTCAVSATNTTTIIPMSISCMDHRSIVRHSSSSSLFPFSLSHSLVAFVSILICHCGYDYLSIVLYSILGLVLVIQLWRRVKGTKICIWGVESEQRTEESEQSRPI